MSTGFLGTMELLIVVLAASSNTINAEPQLLQNFHIFDGLSGRTPNPQPAFGRSAGCESYWSLQNFNSEIAGIVSIPNPSHMKSEIRVVLSVATQLPSVSQQIKIVTIEQLICHVTAFSDLLTLNN